MASAMTSVYQSLALPAWQGRSNPKAPAAEDASKTFFTSIIETYNKKVKAIQVDFTTQYNNMKTARGK
jgi:hypothetical protein